MKSKWQSYTSLGLGLAVYICGAAYLGYYLDKKLEYKIPIFTILLTFFSLTGAIYKLYRLK